MAFDGANIYSLVAGVYPVLADDVSIGASHGRDIRQYVEKAPDIYSVNDDPRKPYLQGNHIFFTTVAGEYGNISAEAEEELISDAGDLFPPIAQRMQESAQMIISGRLESQTAIEQAMINKSGKSMEEMSTEGMQLSPFKGHLGAQRIDFFDPITGRHHNVTTSRLGDTIGDHGIYGKLGRSMNKRIQDIKKAYDDNSITEEQKYSAIVAEGLGYFRDRAANVWNPLIRNARETLLRAERESNLTNTNRVRQRLMRELVGFEGLAYQGIPNMQTGVTNFANDAAREMLKQHMGNPAAVYNAGVMESYPIGPYTFGHFGPFIMNRAHSANAYEYKIDRIAGSWTQNFFASSPALSASFSEADAEREARLQNASWVTKSHDSSARVATIGTQTMAAINSNFTGIAGRLRPEINLVNASRDFSDRINDMIREMQDDIDDSLPSEIQDILEAEQNRYTLRNGQKYLGGKPLWVGPYVGIISQKYTSGSLSGGNN